MSRRAEERDQRLLADEREALRLCRTGPRPPWLLDLRSKVAPRERLDAR